MIKVKQLVDISEQGSNVAIDPYIPFSITVGSSDIPSCLYWRGGNGKTSFIEIGIIEETGQIHSITLIEIAPEKVKITDEEIVSNKPELDKIPIFDTSQWNLKTGNYSDCLVDSFELDIRLLIGRDYLVLALSDPSKIAYYMKIGNVRMGVSSKEELLSIEIMHLNEEQVETLKDYV